MLDDRQRAVLDKPAFATLATLMPDGRPQGTAMWYRREGDAIEMVAPARAVKVRNLDRDPRATVVVIDPDAGQNYVELRGRVEVIHDDQRARDALIHISARYIGERAGEFVSGLDDAPRVLLVLNPERVQGQIRSAPDGSGS